MWATASGAQGVQRVWLGLGRVGRVDGSHLSNRPSRAACPEVEPTVGSRFYDLGGESMRQDIASLRRFSISTKRALTPEAKEPMCKLHQLLNLSRGCSWSH